jgi:hypothetical protein
MALVGRTLMSMATTWNQEAGRVSRAYDEWRLVDRDQRTFLRLGLRFARETYDRIWEEASHEPGDPDGPELPDVFDSKIDGLWPLDYEWMHMAGVLRDAVTAYEVYVEKAREEVLQHHGHHKDIPERAPAWNVLRDFFIEELGVHAEPPKVHEVRSLRHLLTHRRGELRTEKLRALFGETTDGFPAIAVELSDEKVSNAMDRLAHAVAAIDAAVYANIWGRRA